MSFQRCMKRYEKPKCTHAFILHLFPMIKSLPKVSILYPFGHLMNFQKYTWDSLLFKPISHLTMVCYYRNLIRRTLGLTLHFSFFILCISPFAYVTTLAILNNSWNSLYAHLAISLTWLKVILATCIIFTS